ncbi:PREDICTED: ankyrin repeat-containing protein At2g01680-like [Theobroma cacao]|uniref:Ankyrin repeat-containing protein At2g01680-like n=1 Tax=Theobroma cacao TaxID=3641 RepID=A0AB32X2Q7_THECC|nr:PREDICTED: ankyrin repeat-containing protein At2g01680-like [Theobroma cacao]
MDERLRSAAQSGNIDALYDLIEDDADVLRRIDEMEFVDTPLHIAAAAGHTDFAMEVMNLKPSFARNLNQGGFSPLHLASRYPETVMVVDDLLSIDKDLVRVKGREGYTPLHYAAREEDAPLLLKFLEHCPNCILDLTIRKQTALHVAAQYNKLEAFKAILFWIQGSDKYLDSEKRRILNLQDKDGNTVLHIAASENQLEMVRLLTEIKKVDRKKVNRSGFTALGVLEAQARVDREIVNILIRAKDRPSMIRRVSYFTKFQRDIEEMKPDTNNALLVVFALITAMSYQAFLSPPGCVFQADADSNSTERAGKSVVKPYAFLMFYSLNCAVFALAWDITVALLRVAGKNIQRIAHTLCLVTCFCSGAALAIIGPTRATFITWAAAWIIEVFFIKLF